MSVADWTRHPRAVYWRLLQYARPYWRHFVVGIVGMGVFAAADTTLIWLMKPLLNGTFINKDPFVIRWTPVALVCLFIVRGGAGFISTYGMSWVGRQVIKSMRRELFEHILGLPTAYYDRVASGQLITRLTYHVEQVANSSTTTITTMVRDGLTVVGFFGLMLYTSWRLTLFAVVAGPIIAYLVSEVSRRFRRYSSHIQDSMGDVTHVAEEAIIGHRVVKTFNGQPSERAHFEEVNERNRRLNMKLVTTRAASVPIVQTIAAFAVGAIVYMATTKAMLDRLSAGDFVVFMGALMGLLNPIKQLTNINAELQRGIAAAGSIFDLLAEPLEDRGGSLRVERAQGHVCFDSVDFAYPHVGRTVLHQVGLEVLPGQTVAVVGRSGSGKSTLLSLLPRFYDPFRGRILLDGHDVRDYRLHDLREQVAFVDQNVVLFNDTVARNIAYGAVADASEAAIVEAARMAYAWNFIQALPQGLHTEVGQNGVMLSGGQRQRLAIARALLKNAPILILDEATSALDTESERYIQRALEALMRTRTTLVIAHRLSTVQNADRIVVMDAGRVVEQGRHEDLLQRDGHYASLYRMQFEGAAA